MCHERYVVTTPLQEPDNIIYVMDASIGQACESQVSHLHYVCLSVHVCYLSVCMSVCLSLYVCLSVHAYSVMCIYIVAYTNYMLFLIYVLIHVYMHTTWHSKCHNYSGQVR